MFLQKCGGGAECSDAFSTFRYAGDLAMNDVDPVCEETEEEEVIEEETEVACFLL